MKGNSGLLLELWADLKQPEILWQAGTLALCLAAAWMLARMVRFARPEAEGMWRFGLGGLKRILFPLLALLLVVSARPILAQWHHVNLLRLTVPLLGSLALIRVFVYALRHAFPGGGMVAAFERLIAALVWGIVALHILGLLPAVIEFLDDVVIRPGKQQVSLWLALQALFWAAVTLLAALWAGSAIEARLARAENLHSGLRVAFSRLVKSLLVLVALLIVLPLVGIDLTVLSVFGGALGVGLGFGLQRIASNYVSGFIILLDRSITIGDLIMADNFYGKVKAITMRYALVAAPDGREAIIPNETLMTQTVLNYTHSDSKVRLATRVRVDYGADVERAMRILREIALRHPRVLQDPSAAAQLVKFADTGIDLELGFWTGDPEQGSQNVLSDLNLEILREMRAAGIVLATPQLVVHSDRGTESP